MAENDSIVNNIKKERKVAELQNENEWAIAEVRRSQSDSILRENTIKNAEFIFEARIKKLRDYFTYDSLDHLNHYGGKTSFIVDITKVFKGNISLVTADVVMQNIEGESMLMGTLLKETQLRIQLQFSFAKKGKISTGISPKNRWKTVIIYLWRAIMNL
jgi:hypothetical protein